MIPFAIGFLIGAVFGATALLLWALLAAQKREDDGEEGSR